jgi:FkbM family methyltransferase
MIEPADDSLIANGSYGEFEGSARDRVVLDEYRRLGTWAPDLVSLIVRRLFAGRAGTFIDVGANIGLVAIPVAARSGAHTIAFEPEPRNFGFLRRNVARHGLVERVVCHRLACHAQAGTLPLALSADNLGDHRLQPRAAGAAGSDPTAREANQTASTFAPAASGSARETVVVETARIDDVLRDRELARPIVIKLDAQGSEVSVFAGAIETLARADHVVSEFWPRGIVAHGDSAAGFWEHMLRFPYGAVLHVLPLPEPLHPSRYVFDQLSWIADDGSDPGFFDLLFSRQQVLSDLSGRGGTT